MNECILVVDDDPEIVRAIAILLEKEGYQVLKAYNGMEALEQAVNPALRLIVIDVMMPRLDGLSAVMKIREKRNLPIIVLSAKSEDSDKVLGLSMGADDYIAKPFHPQELVARVRSQLRRYTQLGDVNAQSQGGEIVNGRLCYRPEERVLLGRLWDGWERCRSRNVPEASGFLSPHEQALAGQLMQALGDREGFAFWGGCEGAQRRQLHFLPDWMDGPDETAVRCLRCRFYETDHPTHRDFLGSLMGLGLTREKVGDILVSPHWADVLVGSSVADFLLREWKQAGRVPLRVAEIGLEEIAVPEQPVKLIRDTVASLRLDSVAAAGFSISRSAAAELIRSGKAEVNWMPCIRPDFSVEQGDVLTIRGLGKCCLADLCISLVSV